MVRKESENLGEILAGDRIESSDYELIFGKKEVCKVLCHRVLTNKQAKKFSKYIEQDYHAHWCVRACARLSGSPGAPRGPFHPVGCLVRARARPMARVG